MKKILSIVIATLLLLVVPVNAEEDIKVYLDGKEIVFDQPPIIQNGRTLVPVRAIFEALGITIEWDSENQIVWGYGIGLMIELPIGETTVKKNTIENTIDVPAQIVNGRTLVPLRYVAEAVLVDVDWKQETRSAYLDSTTREVGIYDWNDNFTYQGEAVNGQPYGYGALFDISTDELVYIGYFDYTNILEGRYYGSNGTFTGKFSDGQFSEGMMEYNDGQLYVGQFKNNKFNGKGVYYYGNGVYYSGEWTDGYKNGYGEIHNENYEYTASGNYIMGNADGLHTINDYGTGTQYTMMYYNGKTAEEAYQAELAELEAWKSEEMKKLYEYNQTNPLETDLGKSIMGSYADESYLSSNNGNIDSFAAANAQRQKQAIYNQRKQQAYEAHQQQVENILSTINSTYESELRRIKLKYGVN